MQNSNLKSSVLSSIFLIMKIKNFESQIISHIILTYKDNKVNKTFVQKDSQIVIS